MHPPRPHQLAFPFQRGADVGIFRREVQVVDDRAQVQAGPAHQQCARSPSLDVGDGCPRTRLEASHREPLRRFRQIQQVVDDHRALCRRRFGGADVHAAVDQHRIDAGDLGPQVACDRDRGLRLAGGGWPDQGRQRPGHDQPNAGWGEATTSPER